MEIYYHSGVNRVDLMRVLHESGAAGMTNAGYASEPATIRAMQSFPDVPMVIDSGAYQGADSVLAYQYALNRMPDRFEWIANLDVIGDQSASNANYRDLQIDGIAPLWVYQMRGGRPPSLIQHMQDEGVLDRAELIGIGGLVEMVRDLDTLSMLRCLERVGNVCERAGLKAHLFGLGTPRILMKIRDWEWVHSADSSKWLIGARSQKTYLEDGSYVFRPDLHRFERCKQAIQAIHHWCGIEEIGKPIRHHAVTDLFHPFTCMDYLEQIEEELGEEIDDTEIMEHFDLVMDYHLDFRIGTRPFPGLWQAPEKPTTELTLFPAA